MERDKASGMHWHPQLKNLSKLLMSHKNIDCTVAGATLDLASVGPASPVPDFAVVQLKKLVSQ
jgi:hypothetical protein